MGTDSLQPLAVQFSATTHTFDSFDFKQLPGRFSSERKNRALNPLAAI
jgi:hypothetical protein